MYIFSIFYRSPSGEPAGNIMNYFFGRSFIATLVAALMGFFVLEIDFISLIIYHLFKFYGSFCNTRSDYNDYR